jgi:hypothetical protein
MPDPTPTPESSDDPYVKALISVEVRLASMAAASEGRHEAVITAVAANTAEIGRLEKRLETAERALTKWADAEATEAHAVERRATEEVEARGWLRHQIDECTAWLKPRLDTMAENRGVQIGAVGAIAAFGGQVPGLIEALFQWVVRHLSGS